MLFNRRRAEDLIAARGFDVLVASSPENVLYLTGFECTTHWINKGFQQYALFSPGRSPDASLIAPALELDALADGDIWVEDIYLFSPFSRGQPTGVTPVDEVGQRGRAIVKTSPSVDTAMDGLVAAIEARGLGSSRIGLDESGMSIHALEELRRRLPNASFSYAPAVATAMTSWRRADPWRFIASVTTARARSAWTRRSSVATTIIR